MMETETTYNKDNLLRDLDRLPEFYVREILDFIEFIKSRQLKSKKGRKIDPQKDPVLKLMGIADVEPFANKIDKELYG